MREPKRYIAIYDGDYIAPHKKEASDGPFLLADDPAIVQALALRGACEAAGLLDESGNLRKIVGPLFVTEDGCVIASHVAAIYYINAFGKVWASTLYHRGFLGKVYGTREAAERAAKEQTDA